MFPLRNFKAHDDISNGRIYSVLEPGILRYVEAWRTGIIYCFDNCCKIRIISVKVRAPVVLIFDLTIMMIIYKKHSFIHIIKHYERIRDSC